MGDLVSVIMPSYNTGRYITESIESVQKQTYTNWELLIVDDCSRDDTDEIIKGFNDERIHYFRNITNSGAAVSRNKALQEAKGRWIAFLDSDDLWLPDKLEKQIRFMEENHYAFSYTAYQEIDEDGEKTGVYVSGPQRITKCGMYNYCWPGCLTVMYDANAVGLIQINDIRKNNDYAMWIKVIQKEDCYLLDESLALYRRGREGSISTQKYIELVKWHYKLFYEVEKFGMLRSCVNTVRNILFGMYKKIAYVKKTNIIVHKEENNCVIK